MVVDINNNRSVLEACKGGKRILDSRCPLQARQAGGEALPCTTHVTQGAEVHCHGHVLEPVWHRRKW